MSSVQSLEVVMIYCIFFFKQKTANEVRISDWSSDVCSSDLHNPACGTSRNVLALVRNSGKEPDIVAYLETPPDRATLVSLIGQMGISVRDLLREKGTPYADLGLGEDRKSVV